MLMPSVYGKSLFDDFFDDFPLFDNRELKRAENKLYGRKANRIMNTDIKEKDNAYEMDMDLPGFKKDEIQISLEDGYMTVQASKGMDESEQDEETGRYLRRERYAGSYSRCFYIGKDLTEDQIKAEFKHGILHLHIPKKDPEAAVEQKKFIAIEG